MHGTKVWYSYLVLKVPVVIRLVFTTTEVIFGSASNNVGFLLLARSTEKSVRYGIWSMTIGHPSCKNGFA
jgi:hypothetical protein